jgi:hypothetical protein
MKELDSFVGVDEIRECVLKIINKIEIDKERKGGDAKREIKDHFPNVQRWLHSGSQPNILP